MCKKVTLVAALAVIAAVVIVGGRKLASWGRYGQGQARCWFERNVPPEHEIARLRGELNNLAREDGRYFETVARQGVKVEKLEKKVAALRESLAGEEGRIRAMKASLKSESEFVDYKGDRVSRTNLQAEMRVSAARFQAEEATLHSMQDELSSQKQSYEMNRKKLSELKLVRQQMATELQRLETALAKERQAQAQADNTLDDASYIRLNKEIESIRDRISVMTGKRKLELEVNSPIQEAEKKRDRDAKLDKYLDTRFGDNRAEGQ
jgi:chromosome segregation ATPase